LNGGTAGGGCGGGGRYMKVSKYLNYIVKTIFDKSSPDFMCANTNYLFENLAILPDGCSFNWSAQADAGYPSNMFTQTSGTGINFTTSVVNNVSGFGTIKLTFKYLDLSKSPVLQEEIITKRVWVGNPTGITVTTDGTFNFSGNNASICKSFGYCMTASNSIFTVLQPAPAPPIVSKSVSKYVWTGWPSFNSFFQRYTSSIEDEKACFGSNITGTYMVNLTAQNICGTSSRMLFITVNNCGFRVFPNPAKNVVKIEFESPDKLESIPDLIEIYDEKQQKNQNL
jgi:hypothetical protein